MTRKFPRTLNAGAKSVQRLPFLAVLQEQLRPLRVAVERVALVGEGDGPSAQAQALRPGGQLALSAFNAYFAVKYFATEEHGATFDADLGVNHEHTEVRNEAGEPRTVDLWTGCYTPRELRLLCHLAGLHVDSISSVEPGSYGHDAPTTESAEFLVVATRR